MSYHTPRKYCDTTVNMEYSIDRQIIDMIYLIHKDNFFTRYILFTYTVSGKIKLSMSIVTLIPKRNYGYK